MRVYKLSVRFFIPYTGHTQTKSPTSHYFTPSVVCSSTTVPAYLLGRGAGASSRYKARSLKRATTNTSRFQKDTKHFCLDGRKKLKKKTKLNPSCLLSVVWRCAQRRLTASRESLTDPLSSERCLSGASSSQRSSFWMLNSWTHPEPCLGFSISQRADTGVWPRSDQAGGRVRRRACVRWRSAGNKCERSACWSSSLAEAKFKSHNKIVVTARL